MAPLMDDYKTELCPTIYTVVYVPSLMLVIIHDRTIFQTKL